MERKLWYAKEAGTWEEALPLGNGRMGAMVFGGVFRDRFQINEDTLWTGCPGKCTTEHSMEELADIRRLLKERKYDEAHRALSETMADVNSQMYVPYGSIFIDMIQEKTKCEITDYRRELDLESGIARTAFLYNGERIEKEAFVSLADDVLVVHIKCQKGKQFHIYQAVTLENSVRESGGAIETQGRCPTDRNNVYTDEESVRFCSLMKALPGDCGQLAPGGNSVMASGVSEITILFSLKTSFNGYDKMPVSQGREYVNACRTALEAASAYGYEALKQRHTEAYGKYYNRVSLWIDGEDYSALPTDERIRNAGAGTVDNGLVSLLFDYGRYLTICASQPGTQPMNLQGIWNERPIPPWASNYTMNINTQMNYWPVETCDLPECHMPLMVMLKELAEKGNHYGLRGWASWHNSDLWRFNYEATKNPIWGFWQMGGFWTARHIWEHYLHTRDQAFLREYYPVLTGAADFLEDWMVEDEEGHLTTSPSTSPENEFIWNGSRCSVCEGSAMDLSIIYDLLDKTVKAGQILGEDTKHYLELLGRIRPVTTGEDGRILEWGCALEEREPGHRHISHLYGFFPSDIWADAGMDEAVRKTLQGRLDNGGGGTGWSNAWIANVHARLRNPEGVMHHIRHMFAASIYPNMMDAHPPFQIDGNFGILSAICEALMQSHTGEIQLLPALPEEWKSGEVRGFVTRGGEKISFRWKDHKAERIH
mgnify:CR=1 FL=1